MQATNDTNTLGVNPDHLRINELVKAAAKKQGGFRQLAETIDVHPQLVSNWKNGVKTPSPEAQADLAVIAGTNPLITALIALIEKSTGTRKTRLQYAYKAWMKGNRPSLNTSLVKWFTDRRNAPRPANAATWQRRA